LVYAALKLVSYAARVVLVGHDSEFAYILAVHGHAVLIRIDL
jgi:hypothetical protein